jgi:hypothetical protein
MMGKMVENPRYSILSARVTDDEMEFLQMVAASSGVSASEVIRRLIRHLQRLREAADD